MNTYNKSTLVKSVIVLLIVFCYIPNVVATDFFNKLNEKRYIYYMSVAPVWGMARTYFDLSTNHQMYISDSYLRTIGTVGLWLHLTQVKDESKYNRLSLGIYDVENISYDVETPISRIGYLNQSYTYRSSDCSFLFPLKYSRGIKYTEFITFSNGKKLAGYPELSIGAGMMKIHNDNRHEKIEHLYFASENNITRLDWSEFLYFSGGIQFMSKGKERLTMHLVWVKGLRKVIETDLLYIENSGNTRVGRVYSRGSTFSFIISYPVFQRRLTKSKEL